MSSGCRNVHDRWRRFLVAHNVKGVQVHDARLAASMYVHGVTQLPTANVRHFQRFTGLRIVGPAEPLYLFGFEDEPAPLLFYLDRTAPRIRGKLGDAPPGYVIAPAAVWRAEQDTALDLTPVFESTSGAQRLVLLRHGPALADIH